MSTSRTAFVAASLAATLASSATADALPPNAAVTTERVTFLSGTDTVVGTLYRPAALTPGAKVPGIVVTGAWMTVKEQMPGRYARELASRGYVALAFDFRTWGESGGAPRSLEDPAMKIADIRAASQWLATRPEVRVVGGLGICASSGYMVHAAASAPLASVALVAPWLHDASIVRAVYGGDAGVASLRSMARQARDTWERTGTATLVPAAGPAGSSAVMAGVPYYTESHRGAVPEWENTFNVASWEGWLTFDALTAADALRQPLLMVHSEAAAIPQGAHRFFERVRGAKAQLWLDEVTQFDFYDADAPVRAASDAVAEHFARTLGQGATVAATGETPALALESARIATVVASIPLAVDLREFDLAERAFADEVTVDYTSLWGGEPVTQPRAALIAAWKGLVPGFDGTHHMLGAVQVRVTGDRAIATAPVDGRHWLDGAEWRPVGRYTWVVQRLEGVWRVTAMTFTLEKEFGDRGLAQRAAARVAAREATK